MSTTGIFITGYYTFTVTAANASKNATYTCNGNTYTVVSSITGGTTLNAWCTTVSNNNGDPTTSGASGTLTKATGSGDSTISFSTWTAPSIGLQVDAATGNALSVANTQGIRGFTVNNHATVSAASGGTVTLTQSSSQQQIINSGSSNTTYKLPDVTVPGMQTGTCWVINNNTVSATITVQTSNATSVNTLVPGAVCIYTCVSTSSNAAASWDQQLNSNSHGGPLSVAYGGTGDASLTSHGVLVGSGVAPVTVVGPGSTSGVPLVSKGSSSDPAYDTAVVVGGGTGSTSFTAYSVLCAGTTSTGALQNVSGVGSSGQVLTSNGASQLPTWQTKTGGVSVINTQVFTSGSNSNSYGVFTITSGSATAGATYTSNSGAITWTVNQTISSKTYLAVSQTSGSGAPTGSTLTKATGSGDSSITFSVFQTGQLYTPTSGMLYVIVRMCGGGGGGYGVNHVDGSDSQFGNGGGGGCAIISKAIAAASLPSTVVVSPGAGGAGGSSGGNAGTAGQPSFLTTLFAAGGGTGGNLIIQNLSTATGIFNPTNGPVAGGTDITINSSSYSAFQGGYSTPALGPSTLRICSLGGPSGMGFGTGSLLTYPSSGSSVNIAGNNGVGYGSGGGGSISFNQTSGGAAGGNGSGGIIIIDEYCSS